MAFLQPTNKQIKRIYTDPNTGQQHYTVFNAAPTYQLSRTPKTDRFGKQYTEEEHNPSAAGQLARGVAPAAAGTVLAGISGVSGGAGQGVGAMANAAANVAANRLQAKYAGSKVAATGASALSTGASSMADAFKEEQARTGSNAEGMRAGVLGGLQGALRGAVSAIPGGKTIGNALGQTFGGFMSGGFAGGMRGLAQGIMTSPTLGADTANLFSKSKAADYNEGTWGSGIKNIEDENNLDNAAEEQNARDEAVKNGQDPEAAVNAIKQSRIDARGAYPEAAQEGGAAGGAAPAPLAGGAGGGGAAAPLAGGAAPAPVPVPPPPPAAAPPGNIGFMDYDTLANMPIEQLEALNESIAAQNPHIAQGSDLTARGMMESFAAKHGKEVNDIKDHMPSDFYLQHDEMKGKYKSDLDPDELPFTQQGATADLFSDDNRNVHRSREGIPYLHTPFGILKAYDESDPKANNNPKYRNILVRMNAFLRDGQEENARKLYEALPRTDRGIVLNQTERTRNSTEVLKNLYDRLVSTDNQDDRNQLLDQAQRHYSNLPAQIKVYHHDRGAQSPQEHLRQIEHMHEHLTHDHQRTSQGWFHRAAASAIGNLTGMVAPRSGPNGEELYRGRYLFQ
jgi:hypothetical protein